MNNKQAAIAKLDEVLNAAANYAAELKAMSEEMPYPAIRADYRTRIAQAMTDYLATDRPSTSFRNTFRLAAIEAFPAAFWRGYLETSGAVDYGDSDALNLLNSSLDAELGFIAELFVTLKMARDDFWHGELVADELRLLVAGHVNGYARTLDGVHNAGRMCGLRNQMLTWYLGNTREHCTTCQTLNGQTHRARWYLARNYIPRRPGTALECGGYQCQCYLLNRQGERVTL